MNDASTKPVEQKQQTETDEQIVGEAQRIWKYLKEARRRSELEWFINEQAHDNNEFLQYNMATRSLVPVTTDKRRDKVTINRVKQQTRSIVSFLNNRKPFVQIMPGSQEDDAYLRSRKTKNLCDDWYDRLQMNKKNKKISKDGVVKGLGWARIAWSNEALAPTTPFTYKGEKRSTQYGDVTFDYCDTFDIYPDPLASEKPDLRFIAQAYPRSIGTLKSNKKYRNTDKLKADGRLSASDLKQVQLRQTVGGGLTGSTTNSGNDDLETIVVVELFYWKQTDKGDWKICLVTMSDGGVLLNWEWWEIDELPFEPFIADITGAMLRSKGTVHDIREPNRAVNDLVSNTLEAARTMGKLNWLIARESNINVITDEHGQFIEYDRGSGAAPTQAQPAGIPSYVPNLVGYLDSAIMDIGGSHDASVGKNVSSGASGELVKTLQSGDATSLAMLSDNFDDFLVRSFKLMIKTAKHFGKSSRVVRNSDADEFGQYAWTKLEPKEISTDDDIRVKSGSNLPFTSDQRQDFYMGLYKNGIITDPNAILKLLDVPDLINVLGDDELDIRRELDNIAKVIAGKKITAPLVSEKHNVHLQTLDKFIRSERFEELKKEQQAVLLYHRQQHASMAADQAKTAAMSQYEPIRRTEAVSLTVKDMSGATPMERGGLLNQFNIDSDAFRIQQRGGLVVQDPADAENQAQNEDIDLMDGKPVPISLGDNHEVHIETHQQLLDEGRDAMLPPNVVEAIKAHIKAHTDALQQLQPSPGLVPPGEELGEPPQPVAAPEGAMQ